MSTAAATHAAQQRWLQQAVIRNAQGTLCSAKKRHTGQLLAAAAAVHSNLSQWMPYLSSSASSESSESESSSNSTIRVRTMSREPLNDAAPPTVESVAAAVARPVARPAEVLRLVRTKAARRRLARSPPALPPASPGSWSATESSSASLRSSGWDRVQWKALRWTRGSAGSHGTHCAACYAIVWQ